MYLLFRLICDSRAGASNDEEREEGLLEDRRE